MPAPSPALTQEAPGLCWSGSASRTIPCRRCGFLGLAGRRAEQPVPIPSCPELVGCLLSSFPLLFPLPLWTTPSQRQASPKKSRALDALVGYTFRMLHPCSEFAIKTRGAGGHVHAKICVGIVWYLPKAKSLMFADIGSCGGVEIWPRMGEGCPPPLITGAMFHNLNFLSIDCQIEATTKEGPRRLQLPLIV